MKRIKGLCQNFFNCEGRVAITDLEVFQPSVEEEAIDRIMIQNEICKCLELLANAGSTTHRVEHVGSMLCLALGMEGCFGCCFWFCSCLLASLFLDHQILLLPTMMTVTFDGRSAVHITRTMSVAISANLSLNRLEKIDGWLMQIIDNTLPAHFVRAVAVQASALPSSLYGTSLQFLASAICNAACAAAFFNTVRRGRSSYPALTVFF
jgi:uncharacterized membrane protein YjjP (DUF1212 family)